MHLITLQYRIKDTTTGKYLTKMAGAVNFVFNYCNEVNQERWKKFGKTFSAFDLNKLTAGCASDLGIHSQTVQAVCQEYATRCKQFKRTKLNWRSHKRSLGWIPFRPDSVKIRGNTITYQKQTFRFWLSRPIEGEVRFGSFSQDSKGHWFVNLVVKVATNQRPKTGKETGIDLGLKTLVTLSDGVTFNRESLTKTYEKKLAVAQRARKKKRVTSIHAKIKNKRKDWNHKTTTQLVLSYDRIVVGNVNSSQLIKTRMAKSVADASWSSFKTMLEHKATTLGVEMEVVNENWSTVTCSVCNVRCGPSGLRQLAVREWVCSGCGSVHDRDVNAAKNILNFSVRGI